MADIQLRFHKDMLVLSAPLDATLAKQGADLGFDRQYFNLMESDSVVEALRLQMIAGAQCAVAMTEDITRARLAHGRMGADTARLAEAALEVVREVVPQHILVEIGPCGLPLDSSSKGSLNESRAQYADAARSFGESEFDAFFLNGFTSIPDLKCALMGVRQVSDRPVFASVVVGEAPIPEPLSALAPSESSFSIEDIESGLPSDGYRLADEVIAGSMPRPGRFPLTPLAPDLLPDAFAAMVDLEAAVVGFETAEPLAQALGYTATAKAFGLPVLAQVRVVADPAGAAAKGLTPLEDLKEYTPDTLVLAASGLRDAGAQFLRATGDATPACTGALAATVFGLDVR